MTNPQPPKPELAPLSDNVIIPAVHRFSLSNDISTVNIEDPASDLVYVSVVFRTGFAGEQISGVSRIMTALLKKGTESRNAEELSEALESIGAALNVRAHWDYTIVELKVLNEYRERGIELLVDVLMNSCFREEEIERVKLQQKARIQQSYGEGDALAARVLGKVRFGDHTYGHSPSGTEEDVDALTRADILSRFEDVFCHDNCFVATYSKFSAAELQTVLQPLESFKRQSKKATSIVSPNPIQGISAGICAKPDAKQTTLYMALPAVDVLHPDFVKLKLLNSVLGGGFSSRLNMSIREEHGLTYGIGSSFDIRAMSSALVIGSSVKGDKTRLAHDLIIEEIVKIGKELVPEPELDRIKRFVMGSQAAKLENPVQQLLMIVSMEFHRQTVQDIELMYSTIYRVLPEELLDIQRKYMQANTMAIAMSGDVDALQSQFATAPVRLTEFDKTGQRIEKNPLEQESQK